MANTRILVVDDESHFLRGVQAFLASSGFEVMTGSSCRDALTLWTKGRPDLVLLDHSLPDGNALTLLPQLHSLDSSVPIIIMTGHGSIELAVQSVKLGAEHFLTKPLDFPTLQVLISRSLENQLNRQKLALDKSRRMRSNIDPFLGTSDPIRRLGELAERVAAADSPVLIQGETGTGKSVLARWIHDASRRSRESFVDLNCGGLSHEFLESELFGHEKGAFTGAIQSKPGLLEIAHNGTVFLDEIGDVDLEIQPKLLKVLEEKQFRRLGEVRERRVNIRLIAATHRDLTKMVGEHQFREDLFFRISAVPLRVPPLRERIDDIPLLVSNLLVRLSADLGLSYSDLSPSAMKRLQAYTWPGNIRELRNVLERALLLSGRSCLAEADLTFDSYSLVHTEGETSNLTLAEMEKAHIELVLQKVGGHVEIAAQHLGIPRSSLYAKLKQHRLDKRRIAASACGQM